MNDKEKCNHEDRKDREVKPLIYIFSLRPSGCSWFFIFGRFPQEQEAGMIF
jgi:hypothetical protein